MAVSYQKFQDFVEQLGLGIHDLEGHVFKVVLTNSAPVNTNTILANITQIAGGDGYTTGGEDITGTWSESGGTATFDGTNIVWTGAGAGMAQFRYAAMYNDNATSPADALVGFWDNGSPVDLASGETFTLSITTNLFTAV